MASLRIDVRPRAAAECTISLMSYGRRILMACAIVTHRELEGYAEGISGVSKAKYADIIGTRFSAAQRDGFIHDKITLITCC